MKGGCVAGLPVLCVVSPFRLLSGPVEWRGGCVLPPVLRIGYGTFVLFCSPHIVLLFSCHLVPPFLFVCCRVCCGWGSVVVRVEGGMMWMVCAVLLCVVCGRRAGGGIFSVLHRTCCVCCHSIVGLGWCLCGRVVSLWNSGDGCAG